VHFFSEKGHITQEVFFKRDHFMISLQKNPNKACYD
jgi:hypothetical protein